jgi:hypothetical protein
MNEIKFAFTSHGEEHQVLFKGSFINDEGLKTFEACNGEYMAVQRFQEWLIVLDNRRTLSEFLIKHQG